MQIPRCLQIPEKIKEVTYHMLNYASQKSYGSVVYQFSFYKSRLVLTQLVLTKSKAGP